MLEQTESGEERVSGIGKRKKHVQRPRFQEKHSVFREKKKKDISVIRMQNPRSRLIGLSRK